MAPPQRGLRADGGALHVPAPSRDPMAAVPRAPLGLGPGSRRGFVALLYDATPHRLGEGNRGWTASEPNGWASRRATPICCRDLGAAQALHRGGAGAWRADRGVRAGRG